MELTLEQWNSMVKNIETMLLCENFDGLDAICLTLMDLGAKGETINNLVEEAQTNVRARFPNAAYLNR